MTDKIPIDRVWAGTAEIIVPDGAKMDSGYEAGDTSPLASHSNYIQNRQDSYLKHLDERGMTEWSVQILYLKSAFVWYQGQCYTATITNQAQAPVYNPNVWKTLAISVDNPLTDIKVWSGAVSTIPAGWVLCNGENGTVNLSDRFIQSSNPQGTNISGGGGTGEKLTTSNGAHSHTLAYDGGGTSDITGAAGEHSHTISAAGAHTHAAVSCDPGDLFVSQMPAHKHTVAVRSNGNTGSGSGQYLDRTEHTEKAGSSADHHHDITTDAQGDHSHQANINDIGTHTHTLAAQSSHTHSLTSTINHTHTFPAVDPEHYVLCFITRSA